MRPPPSPPLGTCASVSPMSDPVPQELFSRYTICEVPKLSALAHELSPYAPTPFHALLLYSINCIADAPPFPGDTVLWSNTPKTLSVRLRPPESATCPCKLLSQVTLSTRTFGQADELHV